MSDPYIYTNEVEYLTDAIKKIDILRAAIPLKFSTEDYQELNDLLQNVNKKLTEKLAAEV